MEYMQLLQNVFMNSMENDKDIIILNEKCYFKKERGQKRAKKRDRIPNGVYVFIPQYDFAKT